MKTFPDIEQMTPEWWEIRRGIPTASRFSKVITPKTGKLSAQADTLIAELIAERFQRGPIEPDRPINRYIDHGINTEDEARNWYAFHHKAALQQVGFCKTDDGRFGCSPDALVGDDGILEIKCPSPAVHVGYLIEGVLPDEYKAQAHGALIVTGREWLDFVSYATDAADLEPFVVRVVPDAFTELLRAALDQFHARYVEILSRFTRSAA